MAGGWLQVSWNGCIMYQENPMEREDVTENIKVDSVKVGAQNLARFQGGREIIFYSLVTTKTRAMITSKQKFNMK
jgi:hypothetical protein